ncbi:phosphoenolpyruvate--protein phosphotransferase [Porticoccus sp.]|uniref:phosphoenolpyruvate--protein phosphotransferase n=1 Tax=Porticoccus sp. TaxID=2024853 RepID=UPI000BD2F7AA|nr:MAG: phosphoenolpyruvate--protein phosphotransferase [Porticoccus sp.]
MLESLRNIVQQVNAAKDFGEVLRLIVQLVKEVMDTGMCSVYLYSPSTNSYVLMATDGLNPNSVGKVHLSSREGLVGLVASRAEPINLEEAEAHPNFAFFPETGEERFRSFLGAPIIHHRKVLGVLVVQQQDRRRFDESEESFLVTVSAQLAGVIAHADATGELDQLLNPQQAVIHERIYPGVASAPGVAIGTVVVISSPADLKAVPMRKVPDTDAELVLFRHAMEQTKTDIRALDQTMVNKLSEEERALFDVYVRMLDDHSMGGEVLSLIREGFCAQSAWSQVVLGHIRLFKSMQDAYLRERASDVEDLGRRVLAYLQQSEVKRTVFPERMVMIGEELSAASFADVPLENVVAIVSVKGSRNSHMAILGRAIGIPTVMGVMDLPWGRLDGEEVIVDGHTGQVIVSPRDELLQAYTQQIYEEKLLAADLEKLTDKPCVTADGHHVSLWVNTGLRLDSMLSLDRGAEGVGLYRTEIPFLMLDRFPSEEEQRKAYREHLEMFAPRTVTMRTLDIGGDKDLPYFPIEEENPFLGWRGIRICLDHPEIFLVQLRAMMRASEGLNNLSILLPMISNVPELESALQLIYQVYDELTEEEGYQIEMPNVGAMIEVPAAVYQIRELARRVDFLSVGTNDLTQYLLAVDRNNPRVADLYHACHPSVLRALLAISEGARGECTPVSVCGEMAGDPIGAVLLMALGFRVLSMSATNLLKVKAILRQVSLVEATKLLEEVMLMPDADSVWRHMEKALKKPDLAALFRGTAMH